MLERDVEQVFNRRIKELGGLSFKLVPSHAGLPDRLVILPGLSPLLVELKTDTGTLEKSQQVLFNRLSRLGTDVYVVRGAAEARAWHPLLTARKFNEPTSAARN